MRFQLAIHAANSGFVAEGAHLGGPYVQWVRPPKIVLLVDRPTSYSVGHTWHFFDQQVRYPVTRVAGRSLSSLDLRSYNVLILPDGGYGDRDAPGEQEIARITQWVAQGGTLILIKGAAAWATEKKVNWLASSLKKKPTKTDGKAAAGAAPPADATPAASPEPPDAAPGVFLASQYL